MPSRVSDLITIDARWDRPLVERCFRLEEASVILCMPLSQHGCPDRLIWHYTRNGLYSVKSGYLVAQQMETNGELRRKSGGQSSTEDEKDSTWADLWRLEVPPKLCHFIWRGCRNILAVRNNLRRRGIRINIGCPLCNEEVETQVHLFFRCPFVRVFWFGSPLQLDVVTVEGGDFLECWKSLCNKFGDLQDAGHFIRWVSCGLWRIWKCRNSVVFKGILIPPCAALELLSQQVWEVVNSGGKTVQQPRAKQQPAREIQGFWLKPHFRTMKVNCDGAWCNQTSVGGCGWVVRDFVGIFQAGGGMGNLLCGSSLMAEAEAVRMAMLACVELGVEIVQVETDSKVLVDMIKGDLLTDAALEGILWDVKALRQQMRVVEFLFTPRACNRVAHQVASYVMHVEGSHIWVGFEPEWLFNTLAFDVNITIQL
ncbi:uncharacterized protein LOC126584279 [Malus sylvestris]|uniref:uncharacterized protein LOC126584279 n=1 Tax=Malus sylvestris TaxID=3752 RepID=UPI0021ABDA5E|nr:uncharacterized protein LOC126584279 [Malus sylvestris]